MKIGKLLPTNSTEIYNNVNRTKREEKSDLMKDDSRYTNVAFQTNEKHFEKCQRMQDLLSPGLVLVFIALTCMVRLTHF